MMFKLNSKRLDVLCEAADWEVGYIIGERGGLKVSRNGDKPFSSASIIKLNILWSVYLAINKKIINLQDKIKLGADCVTGGSGALSYLEPGHMLSIRELCAMMIDFSDNTATNMLIDLLGMDKINSDAAECGLGGTVLRRKMMDVKSREHGIDNMTTPADVAGILGLIEDSDKISADLRGDMINILLAQRCKNYLAHFWPEDLRNVKFAHKSGGLHDVLHDAGILYMTCGGKLDVVVMTSGFPDRASGLRFINNFGLELSQQLELE